MKKPLVAAAVSAAALIAAAPAAAAPSWAPASTATIHPGVQTFTDGGQCTANFVYTDASDNVYLGQAAHCSGTDGNTATDGCSSGSLPLGTPVEVTGASKPGTLVYNSWLEMQANGETNADTCAFNDLALIKIDPADVGKVNPSVPVLGRPDRPRDLDRAARRDRLLRQLLAARRHHAAVAEGGQVARHHRQRLEPRGLHDHARASRVTPAAAS